MEEQSQGIAVALYQPAIPPNTGNIGRLCVGFNVPLYLIKPLGFTLQSSHLKRAGLDYWPYLDYQVFDDFTQFHRSQSHRRIVILSKFSAQDIYDFQFQFNDILLMGNENQGIPQSISKKYSLTRIRIPILGEIRSYNLANSTAMALSECYRQLRWNS